MLCYTYQFVYIPFAWCATKKHQACTIKQHRYAILIAARNEEAVIGHLLHSIAQQTYDSALIQVFVVADNCTDRTAQVCRQAGATVWERQNTEQVGKGYALQFLLEHIEREYPDFPFDGYCVFDADNVLEETYMEEMNKTFSQGYTVVTSYRNSKNYGDNWLAAGYGLWFIRESQYLNRSRMKLKTSCTVGGTGFMFSREILQRNGGWPFHLLTEDLEFSTASILQGETIGYCETAMFYDEQPTLFRQSWNQRLRWSKGFLQVFGRYGGALAAGVCKGRFACFDVAMSMMPAFILTVLGIIVNMVALVSCFIAGLSPLPALFALLQSALGGYGLLLILGGITTVTEWKKIQATRLQKIVYLFTFPLFMMTYIPISCAAVFQKVQWKPIAHTRVQSLEEIRKTNAQLDKKRVFKKRKAA